MDSVEAGSHVVVVDGLGSHKDVELAGYQRAVESTAAGTPQKDVQKHFHLVVSSLKALLPGTLHGSVSGCIVAGREREGRRKAHTRD